MTRASVLEVLSEDYIRTARAKGLAELEVLFRHALDNAAVPIVTVIGLGVALLIGGVVVTESVFTIPGLGRLTVDAVLARDYPTIQGVILLFSLVYVLINLLIDLPTRCSTRGSAIERRARHLLADETAGRRRTRPALAGAARCATRGVIFGARASCCMIADRRLRRRGSAPSTRREIDPAFRNRVPGIEQVDRADDGGSATFSYGWAPTASAATSTAASLYGARISLIVGIAVAVHRLAIGLFIGLVAGYLRWVDAHRHAR